MNNGLLFNSFTTYLKAFQKLLESKTGKRLQNTCIMLSKQELLRIFSNIAEEQKEFKELVKNTELEFRNYNERLNWENSIRYFFRNSGCYLNLYNDRSLNVKELFESYYNEFQKQDYPIKLLALIEYVEFDKDSMDFGSFSIKRFSVDELKIILRNDINEIFYPEYFIEISKLEILSNYWFISFSTSKSKLWPSKRIFASSTLNPIERKYSEYPKPIEDVLKYLVLYGWEYTPDGWIASSLGFMFNIPLFFYVNESHIASPTNVPNLSILGTTSWDTHTHRPDIRFHLNNIETLQFEVFIKKIKNILANLKIDENNWKFVEIAQNYLIKATFSTGLEQLLWHITTIEALFGDNKSDLKRRLASRLASILGKEEDERKSIEENFKRLYKVRCNLVHGNPFEKEPNIGQIFNIRNLTRQSLVWFLHYLDYIQSKILSNKNSQKIPTRKELLTLIDGKKKPRLDWLAKALPTGFPYFKAWIE